MTVHVRPGESLEAAINRFNKGCTAAAILREVKDRKAFTSKHEQQRRKRRHAAGRKKAALNRGLIRPERDRKGK